MYKVLLVDDERIIVEGISHVVDWAQAGTILAGTARNGQEAYKKIQQDPPHIVISDIRMPGMDGLELVAKVNESHPDIHFILLSGYKEFDYAKNAMQYGVQHYLLKPCNEHTIMEALKQLVKQLQETERKADFVQNMKQELDKMLPRVKEQFVKELVMNKTYGSQDLAYFRQWFQQDLEHRKVRVLLFQLEDAFEYEHLFAVKNIAEDIVQTLVLSTTLGEHVLLVVEDNGDSDELIRSIYEVKQTFYRYYKIDTTVALSEPDEMTGLRTLYKETLQCLNHRFYLGEGTLITKQDLASVNDTDPNDFSSGEERFSMLVSSGHWLEVNKALDDFFGSLVSRRLDIQMTRSYVIEWFVSMIRGCGAEQMNAYMKQLPAFVEMDTLQTMRQFFEKAAKDITLQHYERNKTKHSSIIAKVLRSIQEHLGNPELSLNFVASQLLYMNPDYLGKLFKKETGEKFSSYMMKARIDQAIEWIEQSGDVKIFELAEQLGFGDNPQYFSQVFKKYTGVTPTEYKKSP